MGGSEQLVDPPAEADCSSCMIMLTADTASLSDAGVRSRSSDAVTKKPVICRSDVTCDTTAQRCTWRGLRSLAIVNAQVLDYGRLTALRPAISTISDTWGIRSVATFDWDPV